MPLPPIAVEVAPSPQKPELVDLLLEACGRAASPVPCTRADQPNLSSVSALAIVVWQPQGDAVRIQVGSRRGEQSGDWVKRRIVFEASDEDSERWTATGFIVGTLASKFFGVSDASGVAAEQGAETLSEPAEKAPEDQPEPEKRSDPEEEPDPVEGQKPALPPRWLWVDAAGIAGPVFETGPWRFGGMLGVAFRRPSWPALIQGAFRRSQRGPDVNYVSATQTELDVGAALPVASGEPFTLDTSVALATQRLRVSWDNPDPDGLLIVPVTHWVVGARVRLELSYQFMESVAGVAGAGVAVWSHRTNFRAERDGPVVVSQPTVVPEGSLAIRYQLR